jgi:hypothetical protein
MRIRDLFDPGSEIRVKIIVSEIRYKHPGSVTLNKSHFIYIISEASDSHLGNLKISVPDPYIFLTDPDLWIRNTKLCIRIREAN